MKDFAAIDFETANGYRSSVCSVGVVVVRDAPLFPTVWKNVEPIIRGLPLVAHNSTFDEGCLRAVFREYSMPYPEYEFHCTYRTAYSKLGNILPNHQLQTVSAYCGYNLQSHHNALADAEACAAIALQLL